MKSEPTRADQASTSTKNRDSKLRSKGAACVALVQAVMMVGQAEAAEPTGTVAPETPASAAAKEKLKKPVLTEGSEAGTMPEVLVTAQAPDSYQVTRLSSSKYATPVLDVPQTITIIPQSLIEDQAASSLREVLRNVPGVTYQAGEGGGGGPAGDRIQIRGFSALTDVYVDGVRDYGFYNRDPFNTQAVEVIKGPASVYAGRGSSGGTVNIVSKTPELENSYELDQGFGTDEYYRTTVDINQVVPLTLLGSDNPAAFRVTGVYHNQEFADRNFVENERWGIAPSLTFGLGTPTRLTFSYFHLQENNLPSYGLPNVTGVPNPFGGASAVGQVAPVPYKTFYGFDNRDHEKTDTDAGEIRFEHDFNDQVKLENTLRYGRTFRDSVITQPRLTANSVTRNNVNVWQEDQAITNQTNLITEFKTWEFEHTLVGSVEYSYLKETNKPRNITPSTPVATGVTLADPVPFTNAPVASPFTGQVLRANSEDLGLSLFDTIELNKQWILSLGVRLDQYETELENNLAPTLKRDDLMPTWRTGLTYKPLPYGAIYFAYGTSFNPSGEGMTTTGPNIGNVGLTGATVALSPEESQSFELGTKWDLLQERLALSMALFRTDKTNARTSNGIVVTSTGEVRVQGIEFGLAGNLTKEWAVFGGYALMESEILADAIAANVGNQFANVPQQTFSIWSTYKLPWDLEFGTGFQFMDQRFNNNNNVVTIPSYWLQDAMLSYQATKWMKVQFNITNLWNQEFIESVGNNQVIPGAGRTFILSANFKF